MPKNIFITGISGCVGHYLFDYIATDHENSYYFLVRNAKKLLFDYKSRKNIQIIEDDLRNISKYGDLLNNINCLIHIAPDWGSIDGNLDYTIKLFDLLDLNRCEKVIYFSTASILGPDNRPNEIAEKCGTPYIRGKYLMHKKLREMKISDRTIVLFPTWVLGGDNKHPYSHATLAIKSFIKYLSFLRFFKVDVSFHFIHAKDIAMITYYLLKSDAKNGELVLGNDMITFYRITKEICSYFHKRIYFQLPISDKFVSFAAKLVGRKLSGWDKYCLKNRHQVYKVVNCRTFAIESNLTTFNGILDDIIITCN